MYIIILLILLKKMYYKSESLYSIFNFCFFEFSLYNDKKEESESMVTIESSIWRTFSLSIIMKEGYVVISISISFSVMSITPKKISVSLYERANFVNIFSYWRHSSQSLFVRKTKEILFLLSSFITLLKFAPTKRWTLSSLL